MELAPFDGNVWPEMPNRFVCSIFKIKIDLFNVKNQISLRTSIQEALKHGNIALFAFVRQEEKHTRHILSILEDMKSIQLIKELGTKLKCSVTKNLYIILTK
jgi:hypothetical protein